MLYVWHLALDCRQGWLDAAQGSGPVAATGEALLACKALYVLEVTRAKPDWSAAEEGDNIFAGPEVCVQGWGRSPSLSSHVRNFTRYARYYPILDISPTMRSSWLMFVWLHCEPPLLCPTPHFHPPPSCALPPAPSCTPLSYAPFPPPCALLRPSLLSRPSSARFVVSLAPPT